MELGNPLKGIEDALGKVKKKIISAIGSKVDAVGDLVNSIPTAISNLINDIETKTQSIIDSVTSTLGNEYDKIRSTYEESISNVVGKIKDQADAITTGANNLKRAITNGIDSIVQKIEGLGTKVKDAVTNALSSLGTSIGNTVTGLSNAISGKLKSLESGVSFAISDSISKVEKSLHDVIERILRFLQELEKKAEKGIAELRVQWEKVKKYLQTEWKNEAIDVSEEKWKVLKNLAYGRYTNLDAAIDAIRKTPEKAGPFSIPTLFIWWGLAITVLGPQLMDVGLLNTKTLMMKELRPTQLPAENAVQAYFHEAIPFEMVQDNLARQGYSDDKINAIVESQRPLLSPGDAQEAFLRGYITEKEHDNVLRQYGYREGQIKLIKQLYQVIPGISDIITMAVKEAFTPDIAKKFGQYEGFPKEFGEWAEKQGLSKEWAERYWAAHWQLPGARDGFEMYHRRIIDHDELKMLLRALDVMPFWRERLIELAYEPYDRVDIRRMYHAGVLTEDEVYNAYLDLGYNPDRAKHLTEFTVKTYAVQDKTTLDNFRELTRSIIIKAYQENVIDADETKKRLIQIKYSPDDADFLIKMADSQRELQNASTDKIPLLSHTVNLVIDGYKRGLYNEDETRALLQKLGKKDEEINWYLAFSKYEVLSDLKKLQIDTIHENYIQRNWDKTKAESELGKLNLTGLEQEKLFNRWNIEKEARVKKPSEAQFRAMLYAGIITPDEYFDEIKGLGYPDKYAKNLTKLALLKRK